ncbi:DNA polymerase III subunit gamma/tau [Aeromonas hydrophila]|uniref:DNA polymerase III subunit gamma/tau n=1 Tax=Aeromonas hydrophila TaxID=644 RepID=UPI001B3A26CD|nr:DNA polymerase III subunit gamma/tau [Aeromonas hydrophila]MBQ4677028.1 DNA polymerase III subunit gamma/tau [Aeromonas hydrophila]MBW3813631.1 DNA polymerase III subunit gamma/tau [Aeromonas hydrophila]MCF7678863.1 DNA polymerase III subunit gamma/tau [Aeromonas hydrophila]MCF7691911.1 DNA polymerase III subunit gamma/tau [Aeromonas hydrophila]MCF7772711.1 DNA polymerase III subunit gamma/tau [Aeromonas hydrophila]
MSYQVLARKWRPHTFEQVVGQHHVLTALTNALDQGRLHHAYLLSGTRGVGKTTIARILAKSLNCEQGISSHPCGVCDTCREIDQGNFVDLLEIDAASRTKVEDTRELLDNVQYRPARGRFKVYLIDEVHMLSRHSFNALLKTLEEPPPYVKFLLATTDPQKLPITILSRCLQFHLKSLDQTQIAKQLEWVLDQEGQPFEPRALLALAKAADGSMRDALSLTDQALAHGNGSVRLDSVLAMLGTLDHRHLHQLLEAVLRQDAPATMAKITEIATLGPDFDQLHAELEGLLHRIAMAQLLPATVQEQGADADALLQLAQAMSPEEVQLCYQIVLGGRKDLPWAPDGRTALEMTCLRMLAFSPRREVLHPASLTALPPVMGGLATEARNGTAVPGKPQGAEPAPAASAAPEASSAVAAAAPAATIAPAVMAEPAAVERAPDRQDNGAELDPLFAEQDELLREAEQMGYEVATLPAASGDLPAEPSVVPPSMSVMAEPEPIAQADAEAVPSTVSSMQSLLGKRNLLRSRLRSEPSAATSAARAAPAKPVAAARPATVIQPAVATPAPAFEPQPERVDGQGQASARPAPQTGYDDLPPLDAYEESGSDYEEYLSQGFSDAFASAPLPERAAEALSPAPLPAAVARPQSDDLPPWDLDGSAPRQASAAPVAAPVAAPREVVASEPAPAASVMETIDWDELEGDNQPQAGEVAARLIPSSLLNSCGDPWAELIARTGVGGRLRQLAINSVMSQQGDKVLLTLKPEQRHLISDRARADLAEIIGPELGQPVQVEVTLGNVPEQETPLEIEHRLYLGVREQVTRDLEQDPNVQFLQQRFGAVLHHDSIEPLSR